jgi:hypothetical protein
VTARLALAGHAGLGRRAVSRVIAMDLAPHFAISRGEILPDIESQANHNRGRPESAGGYFQPIGL